MLTFSGVHGTTSKRAEKIQRTGFTIKPAEQYARMFGNGVYMYEGTNAGKIYAFLWGKSILSKEKIDDEEPCVLIVDIVFSEDEFIEWTEEEEMELGRWLNEEKTNISSDGKLTRKIQNQYRMRFISASAKRMRKQYRIIFAQMPIPHNLSKHGKKRYKACAVKDISVLPKPPYAQAEYGGEWL